MQGLRIFFPTRFALNFHSALLVQPAEDIARRQPKPTLTFLVTFFLQISHQMEESSSSNNNLFGIGPLVSPMLSLPFARTNKAEWKFKANLVGKKILNPCIYMCDQCSLPILVYGRMIPCKHVFCYGCAEKSTPSCPRCAEEIFKIERCSLGTVFMCRNDSCKRTYLSQRDLEAHIKHRHVRKADQR